MKKYLALPIIALALLAVFIFVGCGAKETPAPPVTAEAPPVQESEEISESDESTEDSEHHESLEETSEHEVEVPPVQGSEDIDEPSEEISEHESEEAHEESRVAKEEVHSEAKPEAAMPMVEIPSSSVLHLIPEYAAGLIYCPSLIELDNRINMLALDLMPTAESPEVIAGILANTFGAGFESLAELEEIGLDLNQDFAIFMTSLNSPDLSATVHLSDPAAMKQVIDAESEGSAPIEYNGVTYWNAAGGGGSFAIIDNILVFSRSSDVCESVIDTYNKTKPAVTTNPDYGTFLADVAAGTAQLAVHFDLEPIVPVLSASLEGESESMQDSLESDPAVMSVAPILKGVFDTVINMLGQLKSLSATLEVEGTDVKLEPFLKFKSNSEILGALKKMGPKELALLDGLPSPAFMNGAFQGKPELMVEMGVFWLKMFSQDSDPEQVEILASLVKQMEDFYGALAEEWAFSVNFGSSIIPDYLVIYGLKDEQKAKVYMEEELLKQLQDSMALVGNMVGDTANLNMYQGAYQGESIMHNGVEIKSYIFPNFGASFGEMPAEAAGLMPAEWHWYYAFTDSHLFMVMGSPELLKMNLDNRAGIGTASNFSGEPSYEKLVTALGLENNLFLAISPMTAINSILPIIAKGVNPDDAAGMQMLAGLLMNMPENYGIGFSAKVDEGGIGAKLFLALADFRQLIQIVTMMQGMGQMQ